MIDLSQDPRRHVRSIKGPRKPTGVVAIPDLGLVAVASGDDGMCRFFDAASLEPGGSVSGLDDADNVRYDAAARRIYVGYGSGAPAVIEPAQSKKVADIKLDAHPESFRLEEHGSRMFVNLPDARNSIAVVDRNQGKVVAQWPLGDAGANFPMCLDERDHRLFVGCRKPARLVVLDTDTGRTVATVDCVGDADDLFYDIDSKLIYVCGGEGAVDVIEQTNADHYRRVDRVKTAPGARTALFVPELRRLYVAVPRRDRAQARVLVFDTGPRGSSPGRVDGNVAGPTRRSNVSPASNFHVPSQGVELDVVVEEAAFDDAVAGVELVREGEARGVAGVGLAGEEPQGVAVVGGLHRAHDLLTRVRLHAGEPPPSPVL